MKNILPKFTVIVILVVLALTAICIMIGWDIAAMLWFAMAIALIIKGFYEFWYH